MYLYYEQKHQDLSIINSRNFMRQKYWQFALHESNFYLPFETLLIFWLHMPTRS